MKKNFTQNNFYFNLSKLKYFNDKFKGYFLRTSLSSKISKTNSKTVTIKCVTEIGKDENVSIYCHLKSFNSRRFRTQISGCDLLRMLGFTAQSYKP